MKIKYVTTIANKSLNCIKKHWNDELLSAVSPPFPLLKVMRFDGNTRGSKIAVELNFLAFKARIVNEIVEYHENDQIFTFTDVGAELPPFLKSWKHVHTIEQKGENCLITDDVDYETGVSALDLLLYPSFQGMFLYRQPKYKAYFDKKCL